MGQRLTLTTVGAAVQFTLTVRDAFGNLRLPPSNGVLPVAFTFADPTLQKITPSLSTDGGAYVGAFIPSVAAAATLTLSALQRRGGA